MFTFTTLYPMFCVCPFRNRILHVRRIGRFKGTVTFIVNVRRKLNILRISYSYENGNKYINHLLCRTISQYVVDGKVYKWRRWNSSLCQLYFAKYHCYMFSLFILVIQHVYCEYIFKLTPIYVYECILPCMCLKLSRCPFIFYLQTYSHPGPLPFTLVA